MLTIGWFSTGRDKAARQLLQAVNNSIKSGEFDGEIIFAFSNREPDEYEESDLFLELVKSYDIPIICLSSRKFQAALSTKAMEQTHTVFQQRIAYDRKAMEMLQDFKPDICVLAGYMLIVGDEMCHRYNMINLHPATPDGPTGNWQDVIWSLIESRAEKSGIMMHLATPQLDRGPVITYCTFPIKGEPFNKYWQEIGSLSIAEIKRKQGENNTLFKLIRQHGEIRELPFIVLTLKALGKKEVRIEKGEILDNLGNLMAGYDLSYEVNKMCGTK